MSEFSDIVFKPETDLRSATLVEASAGTGKTFNIQNVYLRLVVASGLAVERILVVTFTEAATHELRERLRLILAKCRDRLEGRLDKADPDYPRVDAVLQLRVEGCPPAESPKEQLSRVRLALMDFDNAAVFTIHGFCKRVLDRYAFECGHDPDAELLPEQAPVILETCRDGWRKMTYAGERFAAQVPFKDLDEMVALVSEALARPEAELRPRGDACEPWDRVVADVIGAVRQFALDRQVGGRLGSLQAQAAAQRFEAALNTELLGALSREPSQCDIPEIRRLLDSLTNDRGNAIWTRSRSFPDCVEAVRSACGPVWKQLGGLRGSVAWTADGALQKTKSDPIDVTGILDALQAHGPAIQEWLEQGDAGWKKGAKGAEESQAVIAFKSALGAWASMPPNLLRQGDAKDFCETLKRVAETSCEQILASVELTAQAVAPEVLDSLMVLKHRILADMAGRVIELSERVQARIRESSALTYDGMLANVRRALADPAIGKRLAQVLRDEFKAALVDEFQDTDPVQYAIFQKVFGSAPNPIPLLFVGDPKQAIYGFRGADVFTYYEARQDVDETRRHALGKNYRSEVNLVQAVNELFADRDEVQHSFLNDNILYANLTANGVPVHRQLRIDQQPDPQPFKLWRYELSANEVPGQDSPFARQLYADVAEEVVALLNVNTVTLGDRRIRHSDIAILVCTHDEADSIHQELARRGVHSIRQSIGNIFDSVEASELALVMQAMLTPGHSRAVRSALCTTILPCADADIRRFSPQGPQSGSPPAPAAPGAPAEACPADLDQWMDVFREAGARWRRRSFIEAFRYLAGALDLRATIVGREDGVRTLTNVLQMSELAYQAAREQQLGPGGLLRWFLQQLDPASRDPRDEYEMRLTHDDEAVKIMTVFKSKGLEFPIVFVPTLWRRAARPGRPTDKTLAYHDQNRLVLDLDKERHAEQAMREALEENRRLIYVGITRAVNRTYLLSVTAGDADAYALTGLVSRWEAQRASASETPDSCIERVAKSWPPAEGTCGCITPWTSTALPLNPDDLKTPDQRDPGLTPRVDKTHGHSSFSSLIPHASKKTFSDLRDRDSEDGENGATDPAPAVADIFSIPGGAKTGDCWHRIFEVLDFPCEVSTRRAIVATELDRAQICTGPTEAVVAGQRAAVNDMVDQVLNATLGTGAQAFKLKDVAGTERRSEWPFHFSLKQQGRSQSTAVVRHILRDGWKSPVRNEAFLNELESWNQDLPLGFMTGFVDLFFQHQGKFYIVDWKSNRRNGRKEDFNAQGLQEEMAKHAYYLQYMIYTVAVHGFLKQTLAGYDYPKHFGGVFYIFLRGVDGTPGQGIFHDCPSVELVTRLSDVLARGQEGAV